MQQSQYAQTISTVKSLSSPLFRFMTVQSWQSERPLLCAWWHSPLLQVEWLFNRHACGHLLGDLAQARQTGDETLSSKHSSMLPTPCMHRPNLI